MTKEQIKLTKVKITAAVAWKGKILPKDSIQEVSEADAQILTDNNHAVEFTGKNAAGLKDEVVK